LETLFGEIMSETIVEKKPVVMNTNKADDFFKNFPKDKVIAYKEYWESIRPNNHDEIFRRYLFAYMSVHTTWKSNVAGYNAIKNFSEWLDNKELLREKIKNSGCGLYNNRTKFIWDFKDKFWANTKDFYLTTKKYHVKKRDQIVNNISGLGTAKVSFALEQSHPNECRVFCGDTHMLELYGMKTLTYQSKKGLDLYKKMERHWSVNCGKIGVPAYIARSIFWDAKQNKTDSRYWSYVFEEEPVAL
jgi:thermostable 8-oxoguanine DNA glycosylase